MRNLTTALPSPKSSDHSAIDAALAGLRKGATGIASCGLEKRIRLVNQCLQGVADVAWEWVELACRAKGIPSDSPARAEEITAGPVSVMRYLRLLIRTLEDIQRTGKPQLPGRPRQDRGQTIVPVFPARGLYDAILFYPMKAETWLEPGVTPDHLFGRKLAAVSGSADTEAQVCLVLGAGNVSAIPATDALTKILQDNCAVLLKMNPVNAYLGRIFERALAPLIDLGYLKLIYGGADVGSYAVNHDQVDQIHITGSIDTHDAIVWGSIDGRQQRKAEHNPLVTKPVTSELGNVSPWIFTPGRYSAAQLRFQAENIVASITNNASFNCIATKMLITWKRCPDRDRLLELIEQIMQKIPPRVAYYPGARERFEAFSNRQAPEANSLPWTLLSDVCPEEAPHMFQRESFVCVCGETRLDADSPQTFLQRATAFANEQLWGTLAAAITVSADLQKSAALATALRQLRYGTIGLNQWPGVAYALMSPPWGGYPGSDLADAESGIGTVHNTFLLDRPQKTILSCPLTMFPKPVWFSTHRNPEAVAWQLQQLYCRPTLSRLPGLLRQALRG